MIPDRCTLAGIQTLFDVLTRYSDESSEMVKVRYLRGAANWDDVLSGALSLGLVSLQNDRIIITPSVNNRWLLEQDTPTLSRTKDTVTRALLNCGGTVKDQLIALVNRFNLVDGDWRWDPVTSVVDENLGLRNLLVELDLLTVEYPHRRHVLNSASVEILFHRFRHGKLSLAGLEAIKGANAEIGRRAELAVLALERGALIEFPEIAAKVRHVGEEDVSAGYDVLSFEVPLHGDLSSAREKYIEVKAVSFVTWQFHLSRREIEVARRFGSRYLLYLVPVIGRGELSTELMRVIPDPVRQVVDNCEDWIRECDSYQFTARTSFD